MAASDRRGFFEQRKRHIVVHRQRVKQGAALEQHAETVPHPVERPAAQGADLNIVNPHLSAIRSQQADNVLEQAAFARPAAAHDDIDRPGRDLQIDAPQHVLGPEGFVQVVNPNHRSPLRTAASRGDIAVLLVFIAWSIADTT